MGLDTDSPSDHMYWSLLVSSLFIGALLGAVMSAVSIKTYGTKTTFLCTGNMFALIAPICLVLGGLDYRWMLLGRLASGASVRRSYRE